jgi:hypothetical protein
LYILNSLFEGQKGVVFLKLSSYVRLVFKSGLISKAGYDGTDTVAKKGAGFYVHFH